MTFRCGHPRTEENTYRRRTGTFCALCYRVDLICRKVERDQRRINAGTFHRTIGQRIASGTL